MRITSLVDKINTKLNNQSFNYDDLKDALDEGIDFINDVLMSKLPLVSAFPESKPNPSFPGKIIPNEYTALPDDFIRMVLVPYTAAKMLGKVGVDARLETAEYYTGITRATTKYYVRPGATKVTSGDSTHDMEVDWNDGIYSGSASDNYGSGDGDVDPYHKF